MVDCGNSRCTQERRVFRKELVSWSKKIPLLIGLEQVAEELMGKDLMDRLLEPFYDLENDDTQDWEPNSVCSYCQTRGKPTLDDASGGEQEGATENLGSRYLQQLIPLTYHTNSNLPDSPCEGQPLDLSASSPVSARSPTPSSAKQLVELKVPQIHTKTGKKKDLTGKKAYTEDELQAAVSDIRSGKIGTRRAAVLYGIPRSTLRNKIFKMDTEISSGPSEHKLCMSDLLQGMPNGDFMSFYGEENKMNLNSDEAWERKLDQIRRKHNLLEPDRKFGMPPLYFNSHQLEECEKDFRLTNAYAHELKLPFLPELVRKMAEERMQIERHLQSQSHRLRLDLSMPRNMASMSLTPSVELKIPSYKPMRSYTNGFSNTGADDSSNSNSPPSSNSQPGSSRIGDTLKDIIAKTIAEKVRSRSQVNSGAPYLQQYSSSLAGQNSSSNGSPGSGENGVSSSDDSIGPSSSKKAKMGSRLSKSGTSHHSDKSIDGNNDKPTKKTRPKRGQYRKYNSQLLLEAVRAVQRGEMSVHRAGSYFGVPHSTLEYKVKERHLLRQKKPRESRKKAPETNANSTCSSSSTSSESGVSSGTSYQAALQSMALTGALPLTLAWTQPNGSMPMLQPDPTLAAYGAGFALNTSASELLKKLQRKVQAKTAVPDADMKTSGPDTSPVAAQ